jgi:hypothetical protein
MLHRFRITWLAVGGALLLVVSMSGLVGAANLVTDGSTQTPLAFVDINGNGVADTCETGATANTVAATAALAAADLNGDGTISVSEAAQSGWIGGVNCNHGGYVSSVANTSTDTCDQADGSGDTTGQSAGDSQDSTDSTENANEDSTENSNEDAADQTTDNSTTTVSTVTTTAVTITTTAPTCSQTSADTTAPTTTVCPVVAPVAPVGGAPVVDTSPNAHGLAVSAVANSTAVGGKNCNHGGAVSAAAHAGHGLNADKAAKLAARLLKHQGKGHKH